jgi:hypothetical protein
MKEGAFQEGAILRRGCQPVSGSIVEAMRKREGDNMNENTLGQQAYTAVADCSLDMEKFRAAFHYVRTLKKK